MDRNTKRKTVFLKSNKIGEGELGALLIEGFLGAMLEQKILPESIICVNSAVLITTNKEEDPVLLILKKLEEKGVKILSCGTCLDFYKKRDKLKVGEAGNAMDTIATLLSEDIVYL